MNMTWGWKLHHRVRTILFTATIWQSIDQTKNPRECTSLCYIFLFVYLSQPAVQVWIKSSELLALSWQMYTGLKVTFVHVQHSHQRGTVSQGWLKDRILSECRCIHHSMCFVHVRIDKYWYSTLVGLTVPDKLLILTFFPHFFLLHP